MIGCLATYHESNNNNFSVCHINADTVVNQSTTAIDCASECIVSSIVLHVEAAIGMLNIMYFTVV